ncbi:MAG: hypothetical protein PUK79_11760, partial [Clostridiales bacterium]|nr:hypothetical protein [Clostridiales bacterium]
AGTFAGAQSSHSPSGRLLVSHRAFGSLFRPLAALPFGVLHLPLLVLTFAPRSPSPSRFSHYFFHSPHFYPQNCLFHSPERGILYTS